MTQEYWHKVLSTMLLAGMILSLVAPVITQAASTSEVEETILPQPLTGGGVVVGPFYPVDNSHLPPAPPFDPNKAILEGSAHQDGDRPGTFPIPRTGGSAGPEWVDPALQSQPGLVNMPAPIQNWEGIANTSGIYPPDTDGQVGPDHYVQIVNHFGSGAWVRVWDKVGTPLYDFGMGDLWPAGNPCHDDAYGDPVVLYDQMADRWLLTQFTVVLPGVPPPYHECIAISQGPVPTNLPSDWYIYTFVVHNSKFNDYPKLGVWPDGYYMMAHQFTATWAGTGVWVFDRAQMLVGGGATFQYIDLFPVNPNYGGMLPSNLMGSALPPINSPNYFVEVDMNWSSTDDVLTVFEAQANWPAGFTFTVADQLVVDPFVWPVCGATRGRCIHQPGTTVQLEALSDRLMMHAWYRNMGAYEVIVTNHTVDAGGNRAGIRWYEIRKDLGGTNWYIYQQGTYAPPDGDHRWMGSIAMDHVGNMALGYSVSSTSTFPSIRYAGRLAGDPLGTLPQGEASIIAGSGSQTGADARWGDYSAMSVDPVDDCTFWYTQEYIQTTGNRTWQTRVASFKFPGCMIGPSGYIQGNVYDSGTLAPIAGASISGDGEHDPNAFGATSNPGGDYWTIAVSDTYTVTASAFGYVPNEITGIAVMEDMTTTLDISLTPAPVATVDGTVTDAVTGWPLYASIDIDGYPGDPIWTNPVSGYYSITLPTGAAYTFNVDAFVSGYTGESRVVGPLVGDVTEDFALNADPATCDAPGYSPATYLSEGFEGAFPPAGWSAYDLDGGAPQWLAATDRVYSGAQSAAHTWTVSIYQDGWLVTPQVSLGAVPTLSFWENENWSSFYVKHSLWVCTSGCGAPPANYVEVDEYSNPLEDTWAQRTTDLGAYVGQNVYLAFRYEGDDADDWWLDDVNVFGCDLLPGGLVVGNVYDHNTMAPLAGAQVSNEDGYSAITMATPADPAVDDGFYTIFSPPFLKTHEASMDGYAMDTAALYVNPGTTMLQDFQLPAGMLDTTPDSIHVTVDMGLSTTVPLDLDNLGTWAADFELIEASSGFTPLVLSRKPLKQEGKFKKYELAPYTLRVLSPLAVGDELFQVDAETTTGDYQLLGVDYVDGNFWVTGGNSLGDPNKLYKLDKDGNLIATYDQASNPGWGWRDLAYDGAFLYASDSAVVQQIDPTTGAATGVTIPCPTDPCRALAYDPATDHFWTANFNSNIWEFDRTGAIINTFGNLLTIYGMAWDPWSPGGPYLWAWSQDGGTLATQIDPGTGAPTGVAFVGSDPPGGSAGGATIINGDHPDYAGMAVFVGMHQATSDTIVGYDLEAVAGLDIPWLSEEPISGTVAGGGLFMPTLTNVDLPSGQPVEAPPEGLAPSAEIVGEAAPAALQAPEAVLWNQPYAFGGVIAQYFPDFMGGVYSADDFTLGAPWAIDTIFVDGVMGGSSLVDLTNAQSFYWVIYRDAGGVPQGFPGDGSGLEVWAYASAPGAPGVTIGGVNDDVTLNLVAAAGAPLYLAPGDYWLSFFPSLPFNGTDQWFWGGAATLNLNGGQVIDPFNLIGYPPVWSPLATIDPAYYDLAFRLDGNVVAPGRVIDVTFDAGVPEVDQPGDYLAELRVLNNTPYGISTLPVSMTVNPPPDWGKLLGTVEGLGYCDEDPAPLEGAKVFIEASDGTTSTVNTDSNGYYQRWLNVNGNTYTVTVTAADHEVGVEQIDLAALQDNLLDFDLRWLKPCVGSSPVAMDVEVVHGFTETASLMVINAGAGGTDFEFTEVEGGFTPVIRVPIYEPPASQGTGANLLQYTQAIVGRESTTVTPRVPTQDLLLDQQPNQANGLFSDANCDVCGTLVQAIADNFALVNSETISQIIFWSGYFPGNVPIDPDHLTVIFHYDNAGLPGAAIYTEADVAYTRVKTGITLFGVHEWKHTLTLGTPLALGSGNYWVEIYNDTGLGTDDFFWEVGDADTLGNGLPGSAFSFTAPGSAWNFDGLQDLAIQIVSVPPDVPWLSEDPLTGTLSADDVVLVDVTFDASVLEIDQPGTYTATLWINSNDPINPVYDISVTMRVIAPEYGVSIAPDAALSGDPGETVTYTLTVTNTSNALMDSFNIAFGTATWATAVDQSVVGPLAMGASATVKATVAIAADAAGGATDEVQITATSQGDGSKMDAVTLTTTANNIYGVIVDSPTESLAGYVGDTVTYTLMATNTGNAIDSYDMVASGYNWPMSMPPSMSPMNAGDSHPVQVVVTIPHTATPGMTDTATVTLTSQGDASKTDTVTLTTMAVEAMPTDADLAVAKSDSPDPVIMGEELVYTVQVTNNGPAEPTNIVLVDNLPAGVTYVSADHAGCVHAAGTLTCNLGGITNGSSVTVKIAVTVDAAGTLVNTASVSADENDPITGNDSATISTEATLPKIYLPIVHR